MSGPSPAPHAESVSPRKMIAFIAMVFGMFMAILDIQIVSASLSQIQAGLGASADEIPWVQTSYLIAEVIMIPLSGYLSRMISTRWMFAIAAGGFTAMSVMCAISSSINEMIVWRALQGFIGGGMIPTVFAAAFTVFPPSKRSLVSPIIGLVATLAPTIGPTVGGYLTDLFSWHWLFLVNVVPGIIVTIAAIVLIDFDESDMRLFSQFDWVGFASMALFLGAMEYVLEEGSSKDWFQDERIVYLTVLAVAAGGLFFQRVLTRDNPLVDLGAFTNRNFAMGCILSFGLGVGLYGLTYLYPVYLARVRGYSSLQIGETMFVTGVAMFITAPIAGRLSAKVDPRLMMIVGFAGFAIGTWMVTDITADWDFWELFVPQILRGVSLMIAMIPINNVALGTLHPSRMKNASGLFNLTRNLGGAFGLAIINTQLTERATLHSARLAEAVTYSRSAATETLANLTAGFADLGTQAQSAALAQISNMVQQQGFLLAFSDVFILLSGLFVLLAIGLPFIEKPKMAGGGGGGH